MGQARRSRGSLQVVIASAKAQPVKGEVCGNRREQSGLELRGSGKEWLEEAGDRQEQVTWVIVYLKKANKRKFSFSALMVH